MNYDLLLDGQWNYIQYAYKRLTADTGKANGWVFFSSNQEVRTISHNTIHALVKDYMRFVMRAEFNYPFFNGFFAKISAAVGPG